MTDEEVEALRAHLGHSLRQGPPTPGGRIDVGPTLPAYTATDSRCAKCGARAATTAYRTGNQHANAIVRIEHLERQCTRCSYRWPEATIDTVPPARQEGNATPRPGVRISKNITHGNRSTPDGDKGAC